MALLRIVGGLVFLLLICCIGYGEEPVKIEAFLSEDVISVGDTLRLNIDLLCNKGIDLKPIPSFDTIGDFTVKDMSRHEIVRGDTQHVRISFLLTAFETGEKKIGRVKIFYESESGEIGSVETPELKVNVRSILDDNATDIRDIKPPMSVGKKWKQIILGYLVLGALVSAATLSVLFSLKKRHEIEDLVRRMWLRIHSAVAIIVLRFLALIGLWKKTPRSVDIEIMEPETPPDELAMRELARIESLGLIEKGMIKELYTLVSETVRRYVERKYGILAMELPTSYLVIELDENSMMERCREKLRVLLKECDLVKFAKYKPQDDEVATIIERARRIVIDDTDLRWEGVEAKTNEV